MERGIIPSLAVRLKYYVEVQRKEDSFDVSGSQKDIIRNYRLYQRPQVHGVHHTQRLKRNFLDNQMEASLRSYVGKLEGELDETLQINQDRKKNVQKKLQNKMSSLAIPDRIYRSNVSLRKLRVKPRFKGHPRAISSELTQISPPEIPHKEFRRLVSSTAKLIVAITPETKEQQTPPSRRKILCSPSWKCYEKFLVPHLPFPQCRLEPMSHVRKSQQPPSVTIPSTLQESYSSIQALSLDEVTPAHQGHTGTIQCEPGDVPETGECASLSMSQSSGASETELENTDYEIRVYTGSSTEGNAEQAFFVTLVGSKGRSKKLSLEKSSTNLIPFRTGQTDIFRMKAKSVGKLEQVIVAMNRKGSDTRCYIEDIIVKTGDTAAAVHVVPCNRWLSWNETILQVLPHTPELASVRNRPHIQSQGGEQIKAKNEVLPPSLTDHTDIVSEQISLQLWNKTQLSATLRKTRGTSKIVSSDNKLPESASKQEANVITSRGSEYVGENCVKEDTLYANIDTDKVSTERSDDDEEDDGQKHTEEGSVQLRDPMCRMEIARSATGKPTGDNYTEGVTESACQTENNSRDSVTHKTTRPESNNSDSVTHKTTRPEINNSDCVSDKTTQPEINNSDSVTHKTTITEINNSDSVTHKTTRPEIKNSDSVTHKTTITEINNSDSVTHKTTRPEINNSDCVSDKTTQPEINNSDSVTHKTTITEINNSDSVTHKTTRPEIKNSDSVTHKTTITKINNSDSVTHKTTRPEINNSDSVTHKTTITEINNSDCVTHESNNSDCVTHKTTITDKSRQVHRNTPQHRVAASPAGYVFFSHDIKHSSLIPESLGQSPTSSRNSANKQHKNSTTATLIGIDETIPHSKEKEVNVPHLSILQQILSEPFSHSEACCSGPESQNICRNLENTYKPGDSCDQSLEANGTQCTNMQQEPIIGISGPYSAQISGCCTCQEDQTSCITDTTLEDDFLFSDSSLNLSLSENENSDDDDRPSLFDCVINRSERTSEEQGVRRRNLRHIPREGRIRPDEDISFLFQRALDAIDNKDSAALRILCHRDVSPLSSADKEGKTLLHHAACHGSASICQVLLDTNVGMINIDRQDVFGKTALHYAVQHGHRKTVKLLLNNGAKYRIPEKNLETSPNPELQRMAEM